MDEREKESEVEERSEVITEEGTERREEEIEEGPAIGEAVAKERCVLFLFGVLRRFQHCTGHITTGSWKGRGNQYI